MTTDAYQDAVQKLMGYLDNTVVFAKEQLPDIAKEMLIYGDTMAHWWMWFWIVVAVIALLSWIASCIQDYEGNVAFSFLFLVGSLALVGLQYSTIVQIEVAPKLYIMHRLKSELGK